MHTFLVQIVCNILTPCSSCAHSNGTESLFLSKNLGKSDGILFVNVFVRFFLEGGGVHIALLACLCVDVAFIFLHFCCDCPLTRFLFAKGENEKVKHCSHMLKSGEQKTKQSSSLWQLGN